MLLFQLMRALEFITDHVIYNPAYNYIQIPTENHLRLVFAGVIPFVITRFVPKILFITCQALSTLSMVLLAVYIYLQSNHPDIPYLDYFDWMPLTVVILCSILRSIGIVPVLNILLR